MWLAKKLETFKKQLNFTSSGQGNVTRTSLAIDDIIVMNQIEDLDNTLDTEMVYQFIVCEECGITHCKPGDWAAIRKAGGYILFIPAFAWIPGEGGEENEYLPPDYLTIIGTILLTEEKFAELKTLVPYFDQYIEFNHLTNSEALNLFKFEAPQNLFGALPRLSGLQRERLLAASEGELGQMLDVLEKEMRKLELEESEISIEPISENEPLISFYLDDTQAAEWKALYKNESGYGLIIGERFKIKHFQSLESLE